MEYNTDRAHLKLREYGRSVQNLVKFIKAEPDKAKRTKHVETLVELMKMINPNLSKDATEYDQKIWDDVQIIADFELDVDSPYPKPDATLLDRKPKRMKPYSNEIKFRHYGRSIEKLIEKAVEMEDPKEREGAVVVIGKLMKSFYQTWNKEVIEDELVLNNIKKLSNSRLDIDINTVKELRLFDMGKPTQQLGGQRPHRPFQGGKNKKGGFKGNQNKNRFRKPNR
jgi:hypothetical protein